MQVTPEVAAGLYGEVRTLVDDARMARKDRVVRLWQVLEDSRLDDGSPSHHAHLLRYLRERGDWMEEPERLLDAES